MQSRLEQLGETVTEHKRAIVVAKVRVADHRAQVTTAKDNLAFDRERHRIILSELATIAQRIEQLSGDQESQANWSWTIKVIRR
jgi:hypothetical protein